MPQQDVSAEAADNQGSVATVKYFYCHNCGSELPSGSTVCRHCGEKVKEQETL